MALARSNSGRVEHVLQGSLLEDILIDDDPGELAASFRSAGRSDMD